MAAIPLGKYYLGVIECDSEGGATISNQISSREYAHAGNAAWEMSWYAIQTRSRHEKMVACQLQNRGVVTFLPVVSHLRRWSDRQKVVELPLFPGYAFVRLVCDSEERLRVLQTEGVACFVGNRGLGTPIPEKQIEDIQAVVNSKVSFVSHPYLKVGQRVRVRGGSLDGTEGILMKQDGERSLMVSVDLIQRSLCVRLQGYDLEPA